MVDMNVFLAVDENGVKLATKAKFWKTATPEIWAVNPKLIWKFMRKNGWTPEDINLASMARSNQKPEVKAQRQTPEAKAKRKARKQAQKQEKEKAFQQVVAGKNMNIFLAVDENGVKLATKAKFWKEATPEMWAIDPKLIWEFMRKNGWTPEDLNAASMTRSGQTPERIARRKAQQQEKEKAFQQAVAGKNMNVFLAVDENGVKLATKAKFWKEATPEMWAVPWAEIRAVMTVAGWTKKDKDKAQNARNQQTPEGKAKIAAYNKTPERKAASAAWNNSPKGRATTAAHKNSPKGRATTAARHAERMATDPEYATQCNSRRELSGIYKAAKNSGLYTPEQLAELDKRTHKLLGCTTKELMQHFEKQFKPGMTHFNRGLYNPNDHMTNPNWQDDHGFPVKIMFKNKHILGLEEFVIGYKNHTPRDAFFNKIKNDHIILELIHPDCPGYPFTDGLIGVKRIFKTVDEFLMFKNLNRSDFPLL